MVIGCLGKAATRGTRTISVIRTNVWCFCRLFVSLPWRDGFRVCTDLILTVGLFPFSIRWNRSWRQGFIFCRVVKQILIYGFDFRGIISWWCSWKGLLGDVCSSRGFTRVVPLPPSVTAKQILLCTEIIWVFFFLKLGLFECFHIIAFPN